MQMNSDFYQLRQHGFQDSILQKAESLGLSWGQLLLLWGKYGPILLQLLTDLLQMVPTPVPPASTPAQELTAAARKGAGLTPVRPRPPSPLDSSDEESETETETKTKSKTTETKTKK